MTSVDVSIQAGIGTLVMRHASGVNVLDLDMARRLRAALASLLAREDVRVIELRATGPVFCAGGSLEYLVASCDALDSAVDALVREMNAFMEELHAVRVPVVARVHGALAGAGIGLALAADLVLATRSMKLRTAYGGLGLSPDVGTSWFLSRRVGSATAIGWLISDAAVDSAVCLARGAVDQVFDDADFERECDKAVRRLASLAPASWRAVKDLCEAAPVRSLSEQLEQERAFIVERCRDPAVVARIEAHGESRRAAVAPK